MTAPLVSVLVTLYNREKYVAAAVESILAQTFADFELIIVDDRSSDRSAQVARRYARRRHVRLYVNERNLGDYPNRNRAASLARGRYLKYVDADDLIYPRCLERMVEAMERYPEAALGACRAIPGVVAPALLSPRNAWRDHFFGAGLFSVGPLDAIVRRDAFERIGGFSPARHTSDFQCWIALARDRPVVVLPTGLVWWRRHAEQESIHEARHAAIVAEVAARRLRIGLEALDAPGCPLALPERAAARARHLAGYARQVRDAVARRDGPLARALLLACRAAGRRESRLGPAVLLRALVADLAPRSAPALRPHHVPAPTCLPPQRGRQGRPPRRALRAPAVSVLLPVRDGEACLREAIRSVLAQTFDDFELIVADDHSADRSAEIARDFIADGRVRVCRNERRLGKWPNHNRCARLARGRWLKFLHADDLLYPWCLEQMMDCAARHPQAALIVSAESPLRAGACLPPAQAFRHEFFLYPIFAHSPSASLIRRDAFEEAGGFLPERQPPERHLQLRVASRHPVALAGPGLVHLRRSHGLGAGAREKYPLGLCEGFPWLREMLLSPSCPLPPEESAVALRNMRYGIALRALSMLRRGRWLELARSLRRARAGWTALARIRRPPVEDIRRLRAELLRTELPDS